MQEVSSNRFAVYPNEQVTSYKLRDPGYGLRVRREELRRPSDRSNNW
jgi:hypothetical protein